MTEIDTTKIDQINATFAATYGSLRDNPDLTLKAKQRGIAKAYVTQRDALAVLQDAKVVSDDNEVQKLRDKLTALRPGDDSLSYRDATARAIQIANESQAPGDDLIALLNQAWVTRDVILERAILGVAYDNAQARSLFGGDDFLNVINAWIAHNPASATDAARLYEVMASSAKKLQTQLAVQFLYFAPVPAELSQMSGYAIEALAAQ